MDNSTSDLSSETEINKGLDTEVKQDLTSNPIKQTIQLQTAPQADITNTLIWIIILLVSAVCWIAGFWVGKSGIL